MLPGHEPVQAAHRANQLGPRTKRQVVGIRQQDAYAQVLRQVAPGEPLDRTLRPHRHEYRRLDGSMPRMQQPRPRPCFPALRHHFKRDLPQPYTVTQRYAGVRLNALTRRRRDAEENRGTHRTLRPPPPPRSNPQGRAPCLQIQTEPDSPKRLSLRLGASAVHPLLNIELRYSTPRLRVSASAFRFRCMMNQTPISYDP